jgi:hypothetical protein
VVCPDILCCEWSCSTLTWSHTPIVLKNCLTIYIIVKSPENVWVFFFFFGGGGGAGNIAQKNLFARWRLTKIRFGVVFVMDTIGHHSWQFILVHIAYTGSTCIYPWNFRAHSNFDDRSNNRGVSLLSCIRTYWSVYCVTCNFIRSIG